MSHYRTVLCPVDFSECSRHALDLARTIALDHGARLEILHVFPSIPAVVYASRPVVETRPLTTDDRIALQEHANYFFGSGSAQHEVQIREGEPAHEILLHAGAVNADLIVLGTHGRTGFERLVLGSVAERVLRRSPCPVLTVPRRTSASEPRQGQWFSNVLCPVDFSESSQHALNYAFQMTRAANADLTALHVISNVVDDFGNLQDPGGVNERLTVAELFAMREDSARRCLDRSLSDAMWKSGDVHTALVRGTSGPTILRYAAAHAVDLIVMGVDRRSPPDLMFFGSTTQHVVRQAECPVLTIAWSS